MKKSAVLILFLISSANLCLAQDLNQYRYVQVPASYDFLSEENQYQLNALTAFLFEKYGFEVFYKENIPDDVNICDLLKANVIRDRAFLKTKVSLTLENCKGQTVFTSKMGTSREKQFKSAYHEALRDAFTSFEALGYAYSEDGVQSANNNSEGLTRNTPRTAAAAQQTETDTAEVVEKLIAAKEPAAEKLVAEKAFPEVVEEKLPAANASFRNGTTQYTLKTTASGFRLFREAEEKEFATLLKSGGGSNYIYAAKSVQGNAYFNAQGNLVVEYVDSNTGQLVTVQYQRQD